MIMNTIIKRIKRYLYAYYIVGITRPIDVFSNTTVNKVTWIKFPGHKDNWIADPFLFNVSSDSIDILVEEMVEKKNKGRLAKITVNHDGKLLKKKIILELDTHLSFPIFYKENDRTFVYPENSDSGCLKMYDYDYTCDKLVNPRTIINEPLVDTAIHKYGENYYAFGVLFSGMPYETTKQLRIYKSSKIDGIYTLIQTIESQKKWERGGGGILLKGNKIIRPSQSCEELYGHHLLFQEIEKDDCGFKEKVLGTLLPGCDFPVSVHTYNELDDMAVIDSQRHYLGNLSLAALKIVSFFKKRLIL